MLDFGRALLLVSTCLALNACAFWGNNRNETSITPTPTVKYERGFWFCQVNETWDDWDCVQDPRLAMKPIPRRFRKQPRLEPAPTSTAQSLDTSDSPRPDPLQVATELTNADLSDAEVQTAASVPSPKPAPALEQNTQSAELPDWQRFAYLPSASIVLSELPEHFYAVQIVAMSSIEVLESFAKKHQLSGVPGARVEAGGELYYVLLLGIYETLTDAKAAVASRPKSLMSIEPWIRKLGSLQDAVARADVLAEAMDY